MKKIYKRIVILILGGLGYIYLLYFISISLEWWDTHFIHAYSVARGVNYLSFNILISLSIIGLLLILIGYPISISKGSYFYTFRRIVFGLLLLGVLFVFSNVNRKYNYPGFYSYLFLLSLFSLFYMKFTEYLCKKAATES